MKTHSINFGEGEALWYEAYPYTQRQPALHFFHANGYPFGTYQQFFQPLEKNYSTFGMGQRAVWPSAAKPSDNIDWATYANDLIQFLDNRANKNNNAPVIGVGHSMGATSTLLAAHQRPDLFCALVFIDPVFLPEQLIQLRDSMPASAADQNPIIQKALNRPDTWANKDACIQFHSSKRAYARFSKSAMEDFAEYGLRHDADGQFRLLFSKYWEAHNYRTAPLIWDKLPSIQLPVLAIRGEHTNVLMPPIWEQWKTLRPSDTFIEIEDAGHLVPLERPTETALRMTEWLKNLGY